MDGRFRTRERRPGPAKSATSPAHSRMACGMVPPHPACADGLRKRNDTTGPLGLATRDCDCTRPVSHCTLHCTHSRWGSLRRRSTAHLCCPHMVWIRGLLWNESGLYTPLIFTLIWYGRFQTCRAIPGAVSCGCPLPRHAPDHPSIPLCNEQACVASMRALC